MSRVVVREDDDGVSTETIIENAVCDGVLHWTEGWLFNIREKSKDEVIADLRNQNDILTGCVLEMSEIIYG